MLFGLPGAEVIGFCDSHLAYRRDSFRSLAKSGLGCLAGLLQDHIEHLVLAWDYVEPGTPESAGDAIS